MSEKPATLWLATNASFPGYWGSHKDGGHHAIVECIEAGASNGSVFVVYEGYEGCRFDEMGRTVYLTEFGEPTVEGVYDATGQWLGSTLAEVARDCQQNDWWIPEHEGILSKDTINSLKKHKPE